MAGTDDPMSKGKFPFFSANLSDRKASIEGDMMAAEEKGQDDNTLKFAFSKSRRKNNKKEKRLETC